VIVPVGDLPPLKTASSEIEPPAATPGEAVVEMAGVAKQFPTVRSFVYEEAFPSVVWLEVQLDEATTLPAPLGIVTVYE
jgi:hypothetical protein